MTLHARRPGVKWLPLAVWPLIPPNSRGRIANWPRAAPPQVRLGNAGTESVNGGVRGPQTSVGPSRRRGFRHRRRNARGECPRGSGCQPKCLLRNRATKRKRPPVSRWPLGESERECAPEGAGQPEPCVHLDPGTPGLADLGEGVEEGPGGPGSELLVGGPFPRLDHLRKLRGRQDRGRGSSARGHADVTIIDSVPNDPRDPAQQRLAAPRSNASSIDAADPQIHAADRMESETPAIHSPPVTACSGRPIESARLPGLYLNRALTWPHVTCSIGFAPHGSG